MKTSFTSITGFEPSSVQAIAGRLKKVAFSLNSDMQVVGVDQDYPLLAVEFAMRKEQIGQTFDVDSNKFVEEKRNEFRRLYFAIDADTGIASTPGAKRDFRLLVDLLKLCGAGAAEVLDIRIDLLAWTKDLLKMYETAQLGGLVIDDFFSEPKMIGRYSAKTVDNRIDMKYLEQVGGNLRSIRLGFFSEGVRRTVEARSDAVLSVTSGDEDDLEHFHDEQRKLLLKHSSAVDDGE